jgi:hypothetical protein
MRRSAAIVSLAAALFSCASAARAADAPSDKMTQFRHLLGGSWSCVTQVPATGSASPHEDRSTAVFDMTPSDVVHDHITAADYSGDYYLGYNGRANVYWLIGADSLGTVLSLESNDGLHYDGTSSMGEIVMKDSATYQNDGANKTIAHEVFTRSGAEAIFDTVCTR